MYGLNIEQFLPCREPELVNRVSRLGLHQPGRRVQLATDVTAVPMIHGHKVTAGGGLYFVERLDVLRALADAAMTPMDIEALEVGAILELEQYNAAGLLAPANDDRRPGRVKVVRIPQKYIDLYEPAQCTWFCMAPDRLEIDLTNRCNLRCVHCAKDAAPSVDTSAELRLKQVNALIDEAAALGVSSIALMGGEPTVYPWLLDVAQRAHARGIPHLTTSTNGFLVDDRLASQMAPLFSSVQVSLHGALPKTHDRIVGREGAFARATAAITRLREHGVPRLSVSYTVMQNNRSEMDAAASLAQSLGATSIRYLALSAEGRGACLPQLSEHAKQCVSNFLGETRARLADKGPSFVVEGGGFPAYYKLNNAAAFYGCPAGRTLLHVSSAGMARVCHAVQKALGTVSEQSLLELWHSPPARAIRRNLDCDCPYRGVCAGGCLGNSEWAKRFGTMPQNTIAIAKGASHAQDKHAT